MTSVPPPLRLQLHLRPSGHLLLLPDDDAPACPAAVATAFTLDEGEGLLALCRADARAALPPVLAWWRELGSRYLTTRCLRPDVEGALEALSPDDFAALARAAPPMPGAEYLDADVLRGAWEKLDAAFRARLGGSTVVEVLHALDPAWNVVGRVHFNLAENRKDEEAPFAFLATWTHRLSDQGKAQHLPLGAALKTYAGAKQKEQLLALLMPVQRAAESCAWLKQMVDAGELFHPLRWTPAEAFRFLSDVPALEQAGIVVRMPSSWKLRRPARPQVKATVGGNAPSGLGTAALLDFKVALTLDGVELTAKEAKALLESAQGLAMVRGQWVEVDGERLRRTMEQLQHAERLAAEGGIAFAEAMRLVSGATVSDDASAPDVDRQWAQITAGPWLEKTLEGLRSPQGLARVDPGPALHGTLRPYQRSGLQWLHLVTSLGLGACLADDMGLGKTIQLLSLLLVHKAKASSGGRPSILVAPSSLLGNWAAELARFAPGLVAITAHPSVLSKKDLEALDEHKLRGADLVITSYGSLSRYPWLTQTKWHLAVLDEAQAIKNPGAKQTRAVKTLKAHARVALTGTPVENRPGDLWSLFDFVNPGLLGTAKAFTSYVRSLESGQHANWAPLRELIRPYVLRRLKTDKTIIDDLPEKVEVKAYCGLAPVQVALYQQAVGELAEAVKVKEGIARRGVVLAALVRFKQLCNHPSQWLGDGAWAADQSGKFLRLRELVEVIASRQEKVLVFTQFKEMVEPLVAFLGRLFGRPGLAIHGGTAVKTRQSLVKRFQEDEAIPFFVLSLKAGGTGLNLTAASHVVHFDRWWNPAVENQATDRAFRIGQKRNVMVHKLVCQGTVEERIDALIESKQSLAKGLLEGGAELDLTGLGNEDLLKLVALDLGAASKG